MDDPSYGFYNKPSGQLGAQTDLSSSMKKGGSVDPMTAAASAGGEFLTQYMAQRAAEEEARKKALAEIAMNQSQNEQGALSQWMANNRFALGGG